LKSWITQQADREREAAERKRQRLERLMAEPKLEFKDAAYEAARSEMTEKVSDAVEQGNFCEFPLPSNETALNTLEMFQVLQSTVSLIRVLLVKFLTWFETFRSCNFIFCKFDQSRNRFSFI
jgi:hypothetical protein